MRKKKLKEKQGMVREIQKIKFLYSSNGIRQKETESEGEMKKERERKVEWEEKEQMKDNERKQKLRRAKRTFKKVIWRMSPPRWKKFASDLENQQQKRRYEKKQQTEWNLVRKRGNSNGGRSNLSKKKSPDFSDCENDI